MKATLYIQWFSVLQEKGIKEITQDVLNADNARVYIATGESEEECCGEIFKQLFRDNWTAFDSISRLDIVPSVKIPGVASSKTETVSVLRNDVRYEAQMDTHKMDDGSRKILISGNGQHAYIEVTVPCHGQKD